MELRKVEQELEKLSSEWKALRRKRPRFNDEAAVDGLSCGGEALSTRMPSWKQLKSKVKDDEIFPPEEEEVEEEMDVDADGADDGATNTENDTADATNNTGSGGGDADTGGYSDFGMCIASSGKEEKSAENDDTKSSAAGGGNMFARYAAKNVAPKPEVAVPVKVEKPKLQPADEDDEEEETQVEDVPAKDALSGLESLQKRFMALEPKINKFLIKLNDRDPVTKKPRYGEKTLFRVKNAVRKYKALEPGVGIIFNDADTVPSLISSLRSQMQQHSEKKNAQIQAQQSQEQLEAERLAKEKIAAEERANQQRLLEEQKKRDEERELARLAEEARVRRAEEERLALEAEQSADQELLAMVPTIGVDGVREQIGRMREALKDDRAALDVAIGSLYTLFEQIVRKPEETNFRRVRRDHPKFMEDIGQHVGGREVLIAAGFKLVTLDGVPSFLSKEPHIESDMDGWSNWFDALKKTLEVIEEEMLK